jgi:hypothetical protein
VAKTSPDLIPGAATGELAHGSLRLWDAIAISVSVLAPGMAMLLNVSGVAAVSGGSTPLSFLLGGVACRRLHLRAYGQWRVQRRLLRHHPRRHVLHRLRDRGRLRRGDGQSAPFHP